MVDIDGSLDDTNEGAIEKEGMLEGTFDGENDKEG